MDKKTFGIGVLGITAAILLVGNYLAPRRAEAMLTIKDRDFSMVTSRSQNSGETLFVLDNRTGRIAIYSYDPASRTVVPRAYGDMAALFPAPAVPAGR